MHPTPSLRNITAHPSSENPDHAHGPHDSAKVQQTDSFDVERLLIGGRISSIDSAGDATALPQ